MYTCIYLDKETEEERLLYIPTFTCTHRADYKLTYIRTFLGMVPDSVTLKARNTGRLAAVVYKGKSALIFHISVMPRIVWTSLSLWVSLFYCFFPLSCLSSSCTSTCPLPPGAFFFCLELSKAQQDKLYCYSVGYCSLCHTLPFHCWTQQHNIKLWQGIEPQH